MKQILLLSFVLASFFPAYSQTQDIKQTPMGKLLYPKHSNNVHFVSDISNVDSMYKRLSQNEHQIFIIKEKDGRHRMDFFPDGKKMYIFFWEGRHYMSVSAEYPPPFSIDTTKLIECYVDFSGKVAAVGIGWVNGLHVPEALVNPLGVQMGVDAVWPLFDLLPWQSPKKIPQIEDTDPVVVHYQNLMQDILQM